MTCPVCGATMLFDQEIKVQATKSGGILDAMFDINGAVYHEQHKCGACGHIEVKNKAK